jgi:hypothetical protein
MTENICSFCGESMVPDSNFCEHCGTKRTEREKPAKSIISKISGDSAPLGRLETIAPGTGDLASQLATQLRTPTVSMALIGGAIAWLATFGIGLVLAVLLSKGSLAGSVDQGKGVVGSGFAQMLNFVQSAYGNGVGKLGPAVFVVFPIGACAVAAATQARRTLGLGTLTRLLSGAGVGIVFGLLMLVPALGAGGLGGGPSTVEPNVLGAVLLGVLFGVSGGLLGTYYILRTALEPGFLAGLVPAPVRQVARVVRVALIPLALLLASMTLVGTAAWTVETLVKSDLREGRSTPVATIDAALYGVEHGVHWTELASLAQFRLAGNGDSVAAVPVPVGDIGKIKHNSSGSYRLFGFAHAMPTYTFAPLLIFMLVSALLLALSAGFSTAQSQQPSTPLMAAAWGCLVGPIWALAIVIVNALVAKYFFGRADGGSVFGTFLLGGLVVGAVGGLISLQAQRRRIHTGAGDPKSAPRESETTMPEQDRHE